MQAWSNWSGSVRASPRVLARPRDEGELAALVRGAEKVRVAGAGHSFMPLCETPGTLISMADMEGAIRPGAAANRVWAPAGWSLARLTEALWDQGYSLINQGDVNPQALAGAVATGTHGTGAELGSLSTAARAFRLMLADGAIVTASADERPELFEAARLSLGLLGVMLEIEIDVLPAYHLEERIESHTLDAVEERWPALMAENRHVEFFIFPHADMVILKRLNPAPSEGPLKRMQDMDETSFRRLCDLAAALPFLTPFLHRQIVKPGLKTRRVGPAFQIFPSERTIRFEEMEYEMPREAGFAALRAVIGWIRRKSLPVVFPFEFRVTAADDIWLSPFNKGPCASVSMHQYAKMPWAHLFKEAEAMFRAHGGRPHWAKRHTLSASDVRALYPMADRFAAVRAAHDPQGKFANAHLGALFGAEALADAA